MKKIKFNQTLAISIALILLVIIFSIASPVFLSAKNLMTLIRQVTVLGIVAIGMTFVAITGGVDLSVGAQISLVSVMVGLLNGRLGLNIWVSALVAVLCALIVSAINGCVIVTTNIAPMIATLGMSQVIEGISYMISGGLPQSLKNAKSFSVLGQGYLGPIPVPVIVFFVIALIGTYIMNKMYIGRYFFAIGSNSESARLSGINVRLTKFSAFLICGLFTGIGGLIMLSRVNSAQPTTGIGYEMDVMTAVILGGVSLAGGSGSVVGTIIGVMIIGVLNNGLTLVGASEYVKMVLEGIALLLALCIEPISRAVMAARKK